ncbi:hypothetical protein [Kineococcus sp. SYSU DK018]|uniref:hypothetical protein n=1 Tax=Kineococcus sp. SYSU DK018 TaxID=3383139 RepID=UPI003D7D6206
MSGAGLEALLDSVNAEDTEGFLDAFTDDAVVDDDGRLYRGLLQVAEWNTREVIGAHLRVRLVEPPSAGRALLVEVRAAGGVQRRVVEARWRRDRIEHLSVRRAVPPRRP